MGNAPAAFGFSPAVPALPPPAYVPPSQVNFWAPPAAAFMQPPSPRPLYRAQQQQPPLPPPPPLLAAAAGRPGCGGACNGKPGGVGGGGRGRGGSGLAGHGAGGDIGRLPFVSKPVSAALVGKSLAAVDLSDPQHCKNLCRCSVQGPGIAEMHRCWECTLKYIERFGSCPGFNCDGSLMATAWSGDDITAATKENGAISSSRRGWNQLPRPVGLRSTSPDYFSRRGGQCHQPPQF